jgi:hypothetical protein
VRYPPICWHKRVDKRVMGLPLEYQRFKVWFSEATNKNGLGTAHGASVAVDGSNIVYQRQIMRTTPLIDGNSLVGKLDSHVNTSVQARHHASRKPQSKYS